MASHFQELWDSASRELRWVIDIPGHMWSSLAVASGSRADELKDRTIRAAHVAYHFLWRRVLEPASGYPWSLCRGDPDEHLDTIEAMDEPPAEPNVAHLWHLLQEGHPRSQLKGVIELLGQCSWSSLPAEQQHGSLSLLHRWHPEYGMESLVSRALLHSAVRLLPHESKLDKAIGRVLKRMDNLDHKAPEKVTGSHMLVQAMVNVFRGRKEFELVGVWRVGAVCGIGEWSKSSWRGV